MNDASAPVRERREVTITYLEARQPPRLPPPPRPAVPTAMMRAQKPPLGFYRYLFDAVGGPHRWVSRRYMADDELRDIIHDDRVALYVLYKEGWPAGMAEVDWRNRPDADFKFFGLVPEVQRAGLGRWFLRQVLDLIWTGEPDRVTIETCTMDDPAALRMYQRAGFSATGQARGIIEWRG